MGLVVCCMLVCDADLGYEKGVGGGLTLVAGMG